MTRTSKNDVQPISREMLNQIDTYVGSRLRLMRITQDRSQTEMGEAVGLSFQQFQKYEKGANRISASKLHEFGKILDVPVSFFFDGLEDALDLPPPPPMPNDVLNRREVLELLRAYWAIKNPKVRRALHFAVKTIARDLRPGNTPPPD